MKKRKLVLAKETLRGLDGTAVEKARGGVSMAPTFCCSLTCTRTQQTGTNCNISLCICD